MRSWTFEVADLLELAESARAVDALPLAHLLVKEATRRTEEVLDYQSPRSGKSLWQFIQGWFR